MKVSFQIWPQIVLRNLWPKFFDRMKPPKQADNWYRKGVLLVRADDRNDLNDRQVLVTTRIAPVYLQWSNGDTAGFKITILDATDSGTGFNLFAPYAVRLQITVAP